MLCLVVIAQNHIIKHSLSLSSISLPILSVLSGFVWSFYTYSRLLYWYWSNLIWLPSVSEETLDEMGKINQHPITKNTQNTNHEHISQNGQYMVHLPTHIANLLTSIIYVPYGNYLWWPSLTQLYPITIWLMVVLLANDWSQWLPTRNDGMQCHNIYRKIYTYKGIYLIVLSNAIIHLKLYQSSSLIMWCLTLPWICLSIVKLKWYA